VPARRTARVDLAGALRGSNPPELAGVRGHAILLLSAEKQLDFRPLTFQVQLWKLTLTHCPVRTVHGFHRYYYLDDNYWMTIRSSRTHHESRQGRDTIYTERWEATGRDEIIQRSCKCLRSSDMNSECFCNSVNTLPVE
jgi:hypothetical protein